MKQAVSLSVHRNNRAQRQAKRFRAMLKDDVKNIAAMSNIAGYAVVAWDTERGYRAEWFAPRDGPMPSSAMPEYVKVSLLREIVKADRQRDSDDAA